MADPAMKTLRDQVLMTLKDDENESVPCDVKDLLEFNEVDELLSDLISENMHFPGMEMTDFLKLKCEQLLEEGKTREAAYSLLQSQALAFRHQVMTIVFVSIVL